MSLDSNSYGSVVGVAKMVPRYAANGTFSDSTRPAFSQVETWLDQVSSVLNIMLAEYGFSIPVEQADCVRALALFVNSEVAAMCDGVNGSGRFGPTNKSQSKQGTILLVDVREFVKNNAAGLERMGATRAYGALSGLSFRDTDDSGDETSPIFQREGFGETYRDWDNDG